MKSLLKATLLTATVITTLNFSLAQAATTGQTATGKTTTASASSAKTVTFKNDDQRAAYALGASLGRFMENSLEVQNNMGIKLDKQQVMAGLHDAMENKSKLSEEQITTTLNDFEARVKAVAQQQMQEKTQQESIANKEKGDVFRKQFVKKTGVKETASGLLYKVVKEGSGVSPQESDTVVVNYTGRLIDGKQFDSSTNRGEPQPLTFKLSDVIPGWTEGLQLIKKGGKIELVIPPNLAYGDRAGIPGIPPGSTLVFDVELLDIKPATGTKASDSTDSVISSSD